MRVVSCMILFAVLCLTSTGCSLFKKNTNGAAGPTGPGAPPPKFPAVTDPLLPNAPTLPTAPMNVPSTTPTAAKKGTSILAGTVIDAYQRPMSNAYVRWVNLDDKDANNTIDVAADAHGHFIIQGVKAGGSYKLIARGKQGEKLLAGTVLTNAPNVRVLIPVREDLVTSETPPMPGSPAQAIKNNETTSNNVNDIKPTPFDTPNLPATVVVPGPGTSTPVAHPAPAPGNPAFAPGVVENPLKNRLPMLSIPNKPNDVPAPPAIGGKIDTGPTRVPSCVLVGKHLENLALKDSKGQTWEYKKQGAGKLVLIDFWGTHCIYCRDSMPTLNRMHQQYGARGLVVLGIAIERGADERREAEAVNKMCNGMQLSYRQLMGHVGAFDAGKTFGIEAVPTMFLLDEQGYIIWHHVGRPDPALLQALERTIQARLNRSF